MRQSYRSPRFRPGYRPRRRRRLPKLVRDLLVLSLLCGAFYGAKAIEGMSVDPASLFAGFSTPPSAAGGGDFYGLCAGPPHYSCVMDGDTFYEGSASIRIADIDAPETHPPRCDYEAQLGEAATARLQELLNAGPFALTAWPGRDEDQYGRKLRVVMRDGQSLGDVLVSEELARTWTGRRQPWC